MIAAQTRQDREELHQAIRTARVAGAKLADLATASGLGIATIHRIIKETQP